VSERARILVVEDNPDFLEVVRALLSYSGMDPIAARSGAECLAIVRREPVDLVLLDVMMPRMDGLEVCAELKKLAPSLPVILLTARDDLATRAAAIELGVRDFVAKPTNFPDLLARIATQLEVARLEKKIESIASPRAAGQERETEKPS
jgi:DNA-binding response OmpR family regulator